MEFALRTVVVGVAWTLVASCVTGDQDDTGTTGAQDTSTSTDGTPTDGGTGDDPTVGEPGDPALQELCAQVFADGLAIVTAQCQCYADQGSPEPVADCIAAGMGAATDECTCEVYSRFPAIKAGLDCVNPARTMMVGCISGLSCVDDSMAFALCENAYYDELQSCDRPEQDALAQAAIVCGMEAPFTCGSGEVVPQSWQCDLEQHCEDATDEKGCPNSFECADGQGFIDIADVCDGNPNCADGSDELDCPLFMCANGNAIVEKQRCDGYLDCCQGDEDCPDTSDEDGCPTFECMNGETIPLAFECDDYPDCTDGSDELDCDP